MILKCFLITWCFWGCFSSSRQFCERRTSRIGVLIKECKNDLYFLRHFFVIYTKRIYSFFHNETALSRCAISQRRKYSWRCAKIESAIKLNEFNRRFDVSIARNQPIFRQARLNAWTRASSALRWWQMRNSFQINRTHRVRSMNQATSCNIALLRFSNPSTIVIATPSHAIVINSRRMGK